jgi:hypothetical protein
VTSIDNIIDGIRLADNSTYTLVQNNICSNNATAVQQYGVREVGASIDNNIIKNNQTNGNTVSQITTVGASTIVKYNVGFATENNGTGTLLSGGTTSVINHGLAVTPVAGQIWVTPTSAMGDARYLYLDTYTATQFTVHSDVDPATANITFAWGKS